MYLPPHFAQADPAHLHALMRSHPLATLVSGAGNTLEADHLPLEFDSSVGTHGTLYGHVARANPLWRLAAGTPVLAVFGGPQAYVSPSGYPGKPLTHQVVPTWNYVVVHARGVLNVVDDAPWLRAMLSRLTARHEANQPTPWSVNDAPEDYVQRMLAAIVGIAIPLTQLAGKWKVSQNRSKAERQALGAAFDAGAEASRAMAALVREGVPPAGK